jgi:hypothetical protein
MSAPVMRVVATGASNLALGMQTLLSTARGAWGENFEVLSAHGYGRSYGARSRIAVRTLPGILQSGLWDELRHLPEARIRGLIMDVGDDIAYGFDSARILAWIEQTAARLLAHTRDVVITDLPVESVRRLSPAGFLFSRTLFFPSSRVSRDVTFARMEEVNQGLGRLAAERKLRLVHLKPEWYGIDPIHLRPGAWREAWREILLGDESAPPAAPLSALEWASVHTRAPHRRWLLGLEQNTPQPGRRLRRGGRLWSY